MAKRRQGGMSATSGPEPHAVVPIDRVIYYNMINRRRFAIRPDFLATESLLDWVRPVI